jgi:hypothetical protein
MADSEYVNVRNEELREKVEKYQDRAGYEQLSTAAEDLLRTGLRETQSPLLSRFRERAIVIGELLSVFALIFLIAGVLYPPYPFAESLIMAIVLVSLAVAIPGSVELARVIRGSNELGAVIREVVG